MESGINRPNTFMTGEEREREREEFVLELPRHSLIFNSKSRKRGGSVSFGKPEIRRKVRPEGTQAAD